jgi:hypothetical protein
MLWAWHTLESLGRLVGQCRTSARPLCALGEDIYARAYVECVEREPGRDLRFWTSLRQPGLGRHFNAYSDPRDGTSVSCVRGAGRLSIGHDLASLWRDTMLMRQADLARLNEPYPENVEPPDSAAVAALGMELPNVTAL